MATITTLTQTSAANTGSTKQWKPTFTLYENEIDFAEVLVEKGSALAAADVIEAIRIAPGSIVIAAGIETVLADDATTLTLDVGTAVDADRWVDGYDQAAAVAGAYSQSTATSPFEIVGATSDTVDVTFATLTGTLTIGKIRVFAMVANVDPAATVGIAQIGS